MANDVKNNGVDWPIRLTLRDAKVFADEGQRIFTTATGYGYQKREYVRADAAAADARVLLKALKVALEVMENVDGENDCSRGIRAVEVAIAKAEDLINA